MGWSPSCPSMQFSTPFSGGTLHPSTLRESSTTSKMTGTTCTASRHLQDVVRTRHAENQGATWWRKGNINSKGNYPGRAKLGSCETPCNRKDGSDKCRLERKKVVWYIESFTGFIAVLVPCCCCDSLWDSGSSSSNLTHLNCTVKRGSWLSWMYRFVLATKACGGVCILFSPVISFMIVVVLCIHCYEYLTVITLESADEAILT